MKTACPPLVLPRSLRPALRTNTVPDFLVPRLWAISSKRHGTSNRTILTASSERKNDVNTVKPVLELSKAQRHYLDSALRVNHAGELAATLIYAAQTPLLIRAHPKLRSLLKKMYDQEAGHFSTFETLLAKHRVRPTAMYPVWQLAATTLGWVTAISGREVAMACTEAVETEIGNHYNSQVRTLLEWAREAEEKGYLLNDELSNLIEEIRRIRDEELEHLDEAVENDAQAVQGHAILTGVIRGGCRAAIWISERI